VRVVIVEDASRFARELMTQELGILALMKRGARVLTANGDDLTDESDPSRKMMRQIAGAFAEYEKARLISKLRHAREAKRAATGRCEGRPPVPEVVLAEARRLARKSPKTGKRRSLRAIVCLAFARPAPPRIPSGRYLTATPHRHFQQPTIRRRNRFGRPRME
jgi:DNA invertase Pin-like site-specific DNA recombinase